MKKVFTIIVAIISLCILATASISASDVAENTDTIEFFEFTESNARMGENGNFEFLVRIRLVSDEFYATSNRLDLRVKAWIYNQAYDPDETPDEFDTHYIDTSVRYTVTLYKKVGLGGREEVGHYTGSCSNQFGGRLFSVESGEAYFLEITSGYDFTGSPRFIKGEGSVSPMSLEAPE